MFKLVIEDDEGNKTVVPIIRDEITIGRKDGNTIRLTERNVSRDHARLVRQNGAVYLEEVSARYGTRKNGERIDGRTDFDVGDVFTIGDYRLTLQSDVAPEAKAPSKSNGAVSGDEETKVAPPPTPVTAKKKEGTEIIAADPAKLVIVSSNFAGQEFPLARKEMVIGRGEECDIIIDHRSVSQKHAKVIRESDGEYKIVDLKSKNGVKVGGEEYRAVHLKRGDIVELGHVKFRFVEPGENYIFTPQADEDIRAAKPKGPLVLVGVLAIAVVSIAIGFFLYSGRTQPDEDLGTAPEPTTTNNETTGAVEPIEVADANGLDHKIDKAEQDFLAGKVQKAAGMLELLREENEITPAQVERIDNLLSKTKREKGFVRYFENGRDHFAAERWLDALEEFRQIPDDDELNIYQLVKEGRYIDQSVANATEEQLAIAQNAEDEDEQEAARDKLAELQAMFPNHVAPTEAIAELAAAQPDRPIKRPRPKPVNENGGGEITLNRPDPKPKPQNTQNLELADALHKKAMSSLMKGDYKDAISKAKTARDNGCTTKCYRVLGMAHHKLGESKPACKWFAKAGSELPNDLDCP